MCVLTLRSLTTKDGQIQQDDRPTSCNDGSQDFNKQQCFPIKEEDKDEKKTDTSFNPDRSLNKDAVVNEYLSELTPVDDKMKKHGLRNITSEMARDYRIVDPKTRVHKGKHRKVKNNSKPRDTFLHLLSCEPLLTVFEICRKENMRQLFLMLFLIILIQNTCANIKSKQSCCRKYPCLNSILYLLWQSGDVEVNPGPAKSSTYRNWLYEVCPIARKAIAGVSTDCKMNKIWQQKPKNWQPKKSYFNPRKKSVNEVEDLLINLLHCCDDTSKLPDDICSEIDTWNAHRSKDNGKLLHLYRTRKCCMSIKQVNSSLKVLQSHLSAYDAQIIEGNTCIQISLYQPARDQPVITHNIYKSVATRKMSSFLVRILHGKDPERKCDKIWKLMPDGWPSCLRYYNPNNGGERCAEKEDGMVVKALITLCEKKSIILPKSYKDMVDAWQADDQTLLSKLMTRHTAETDLKRTVMKLHKEGLLQDSEVDKKLRELGLFVQCESKKQKRKMANTINKHETKRTKQCDNEGAVDTTPNELFPDCSLGELLRNDSKGDPLPDMIRKYLPESLNGAFDDLQC